MDDLESLKTDPEFILFEAGYKHYRSLITPCEREYDNSAFITCAKAFIDFKAKSNG